MGAEGQCSNPHLLLNNGKIETLQRTLLEPGVRGAILDLHDSLKKLPQNTPVPRLSNTTRKESTLLRKRPKRLNHDQVDQLLEAYRAGEKVNDLSARFVVHRDTVLALTRKAGLPGRYPKLTSEQVKVAKRLYSEGLSTLVIAKQFGVAGETVRVALQNAGAKLRKRNGR